MEEMDKIGQDKVGPEEGLKYNIAHVSNIGVLSSRCTDTLTAKRGNQ